MNEWVLSVSSRWNCLIDISMENLLWTVTDTLVVWGNKWRRYKNSNCVVFINLHEPRDPAEKARHSCLCCDMPEAHRRNITKSDDRFSSLPRRQNNALFSMNTNHFLGDTLLVSSVISFCIWNMPCTWKSNHATTVIHCTWNMIWSIDVCITLWYDLISYVCHLWIVWNL